MTELMKDDKRHLVLTHRRALLDQLSIVLTNAGVPHGFRAAGRPRNADARVQLAMVQTERSKSFDKQTTPLARADVVHVDEAHTMSTGASADIIYSYNALGAAVLGYSATPQELGGLYQDMVEVATVRQLIQEGYLVPPVIYTPDGPAVQRLETLPRNTGGEYNPKALSKVWNTKVILGRTLDHYNKINPDRKPCLGFASGVEESVWFAKQYDRAGVTSAHIDGDNVWWKGETYKSDPEVRAALFHAVKTGKVQVLWNRFVLREGIDLPEVAHIILACVFGSRVSYVQSCGRGLRPAPGKSRCIVQDHGGNAWRFPGLDTDETWDIYSTYRIQAATRADALRDQRIPEPIVCTECDCLRAAGDTCPECGHRKTTRARRVVELDGTLHIQKGPLYKPRREKTSPALEDEWKGVVIGNLKRATNRSFRQVYTNFARTHQWQYPPKDSPLMPRPEFYDVVMSSKMSEVSYSQLNPR